MGFVYNNTWEAFCKTYFELHGYFVTTNLFAALQPMELTELAVAGVIETDDQDDGKKPKSPSRNIEADLVAYRMPKTDLGGFLLDKAGKKSDPFEFFAGDANKCKIKDKASAQTLIYAEVRANLTIHSPHRQVAKMFDKGEGKKSREGRKIERMTGLLEKRFGVKPLVVVMAYHLGPQCKPLFMKNDLWRYKEFRTMFEFMQRRMRIAFQSKTRVLYNDPFLELFRYLERERETPDH